MSLCGTALNQIRDEVVFFISNDQLPFATSNRTTQNKSTQIETTNVPVRLNSQAFHLKKTTLTLQNQEPK